MGDILETNDLVHAKIEEEKVTLCNLFWIGISIFIFILDLGLDIKLAVDFFVDDNMWFFAQTLICIIIPAFILCVFNIWWYEDDAKSGISKVSDELLVIRQLQIVLLMGPLVRDFEALYYGVKSMRSTDHKEIKDYYHRMKLFVVDAALLRLFEAFMECGPQVVLQLYILAQSQASEPNSYTTTEIWQMCKIFISFTSMSLVYANYQRSLRLCMNDRGRLNLLRTAFIAVWRFFDIASRVLALGLFASIFPYHLLMICFAHFIAMFIWIRTMVTDFHQNNKFKEFIYNLVLAEVFVFFYFNPRDDKTRYRYTAYYILIFFENTTLICLWFYYYSPVVDLRLPAFILQFLSFAVAVVLMVVYYYFFHPTRGVIKKKPETTEKESETKMKNYKDSAKPDENKNVITEKLVL